MGRRRSWSEDQLRDAIKKSKSIRQVIAQLSLIPAGGNYEQIKRCIQKLSLSTSHFTGAAWNRGLRGIGKPRIPLGAVLVSKSTYQSFKLKRRLFREGLKSPQCEECGWAQVSIDGRVPLELDHINGDHQDNRLENLRILCPNCHSLKPTHRGRNMKNARVAKLADAHHLK